MEPTAVSVGTPTWPTRRVGGKTAASYQRLSLAQCSGFGCRCRCLGVEVGPPVTSEPLAQLADEIRSGAWDLALAVVEEGLREDTIPPLARLARAGQLGDMPTFIAELADHLLDPKPERLRRGSPLAAIVRDHAREREALGFAPRDIVTEFLVLRRVLWRLVLDRSATLAPDDVFVLEERLHDMIDRLITECVVVYFDFDDFKEINDTFGHQAGDDTLRRVARLLRGELRQSDLAGRMGGDEFAALLVESAETTGANFLARLRVRLRELVEAGELAVQVAISAGVGRYPDDGADAATLFAVADRRLYEAKRARAA